MMPHKNILFGDKFEFMAGYARHHSQDVLEEGDVNIRVDLRGGDEVRECVDPQELEVN